MLNSALSIWRRNVPHITLDPAATSLLAVLSGNVEIRDAAGKVIG